MVYLRKMGMRPAALALVLAAGLCARSALGQGSDGAAPAKADAQPSSVSSTLKEIKEELFGPSGPAGITGSLNPMVDPTPNRPPQMLPRVEDERTRLLRQREQEWIFSDLNDLSSPPTLEDLACLPDYSLDGRDKNKIPPMERYIEELELKRGAGSNNMNSFMTQMLNQTAFPGSSNLNSMMLLMPGMNGLTGNTPDGSNSAAADNRGAVGGFTGDVTGSDAAALLDQKRRLESFKRLLTSDSSGTAPGSPEPADTFGRFSDLLNFGAPPVTTGAPGTAPAAPTASPGSPSPAPGGVDLAGPGYHNSMNDAPPTSFSVPGATRLTTLPPPPPPPKPVSLDPFKDNMPKRAF